MKKLGLVFLLSLFLSSSVAFATQQTPAPQDGIYSNTGIVLFDDTFPNDPPDDPDDPIGFM